MSGGERAADLLEQLRAMIQSARWIPIGSDKCVIDRGAALDLIDEARSVFPQELSEAQRLVSARSDFIANAKREAEAIRHAAEERSRQLVDEQEVLRTARAESRDLLVSAETKADNLRHSVTEYVDEMLRSSVSALSTALDEMQNTRARFTEATGGRSGETREPEPDSQYEDTQYAEPEYEEYDDDFNIDIED
ncbi:MAG: hypothetical protein LBN00_04600 [Oscillospiraceae bacterium]|jgi:F0F1-type ATP synthase membrane subunit b/b'|nr:hypothetical protein [Oscillospiraceae bacterium]